MRVNGRIMSNLSTGSMEQLRLIFYPEFFVKCAELTHNNIRPQVFENITWTLANILGQEQATDFRDKLLTHPLFYSLYNLRFKFSDRPDLVEHTIWLYGNVIRGPKYPSLEYSRLLVDYSVEMLKKYSPYHVSDQHSILYEAMYVIQYFLEPSTDRAERRELLHAAGVMPLVLQSLDITEPRRLKPVLEVLKMYCDSMNKKYTAELAGAESIKVDSAFTSVSKLSPQSARTRVSCSPPSKYSRKCSPRFPRPCSLSRTQSACLFSANI
jgi:hypothetical protein